jgi:cytochrome c-type biogenesis protein CcmF
MEKRNALRIWTVLLAILAFSLSLLGTFLVRSGVLTSVHTFAADPTRGVFILAILVIFIGGSLTLFAFRAGTLAPGGIFAPISREGALILNNLFLTAAAGAVLVGTLYPLVLEALTGDRISVGAPFFNLIFLPLVTPLLIIVPFGPLLAWKRGDLRAASERLVFAFGAAILAAMLAAWLAGAENLLALFGIGVGAWLVVGALSEVAFRVKLFSAPPAETVRRLRGLPRSAYGTMLAHLGVGVTVLGIVIASNFMSERILTMRPGHSITLGGKTVTFDDVVLRRGPNYDETVASFTVRSDGGTVLTVMEPTKRRFATRQTETTEAAIATFGTSQLYVSLGDIAPDKATVVRAYWKPFVTFIWLGALVMALGGTLSLSDRRLRVGAPRPAKAIAVPAE